MTATSYDFLSKTSVASYQVICISVNSSNWNNVTTCIFFSCGKSCLIVGFERNVSRKYNKKVKKKRNIKKYSQLLTVFSLWSVWCSFQQPTAVLFTRPKKRTPFFDTALAVDWVLKIFWTLKLIKHVELSKNMQDIEHIYSILKAGTNFWYTKIEIYVLNYNYKQFKFSGKSKMTETTWNNLDILDIWIS